MIRRVVFRLFLVGFITFSVAWIGSYWLGCSATFCPPGPVPTSVVVNLGAVRGELSFVSSSGILGYFIPQTPPEHWWGSYSHVQKPEGDYPYPSSMTILRLPGWLVVAPFGLCVILMFLRGAYRRHKFRQVAETAAVTT
jgi:hypothetical protein